MKLELEGPKKNKNIITILLHLATDLVQNGFKKMSTNNVHKLCMTISSTNDAITVSIKHVHCGFID